MTQTGAREFFSALYEGIGAGWIEIRPLLDDDDPRKNTEEGKKQEWQWRRFFPWPGALDHCLKYCASINGLGQAHVYFGVALRKNDRGGKKDDVGCATAVFCDVDFKDVQPEAARKLIHEFPLKPSAILRSGRGLHVYWLLKEPVMAGGFPKLEGVNRAMLKYFGAQAGPQDVSRILRVPGTVNIKKKYPDPKPVVEVSYWHPEKRYILDDFEQFITVEDTPPVPAPAPKPKAAKEYVLAPEPAARQPHEAASRVLSDEEIEKLAEAIAEIWYDGHRHFFALNIAGMMAHHKFSEASALRIIDRVCQMKGDNQALDRRTAVTDSYRKFAADAKVAGLPMLERQISDSMPKDLTASEGKEILERRLKHMQNAVKTLNRVAKDVAARFKKEEKEKKRESGGDGTTKKRTEPNFHFAKPIVKFDSRPARYSAAIALNNNGGKEYTATAERSEFFSYNKFKELVFEQHDIVLAALQQITWENMLAKAEIELKEAPKEARPDGAIAEALEEFLQDAKLNPEVGLLKSHAGYDETSMFFRYGAFKNFLMDKGHRLSDQLVYERLKALGWEAKKKRHGKKALNLWIKGLTEQGGGGPEPQPVPAGGPQAAPEPPKKTDGELFDGSENKESAP